MHCHRKYLSQGSKFISAIQIRILTKQRIFMTSLTHPQIKTLPLGADYKQIAGGFQKIHTLYHRTISDCFSDIIIPYLSAHPQKAVTILEKVEKWVQKGYSSEKVMNAAKMVAFSLEDKEKGRAQMLYTKLLLERGRNRQAKNMFNAILINIDHKQSLLQYKCLEAEFLGLQGKKKEALKKLAKLADPIATRQNTEKKMLQLLLVREKVFKHLGMFSEAQQQIKNAISYLLQIQHSNHQKSLLQLYLRLSQLQKLDANYQAQYCSLICAAKCLTLKSTQEKIDSQTEIKLSQLLIQNLLKRCEYQQAISQLNKLLELTRKLHGSASMQYQKVQQQYNEAKIMEENSQRAGIISQKWFFFQKMQKQNCHHWKILTRQ